MNPRLKFPDSIRIPVTKEMNRMLFLKSKQHGFDSISTMVRVLLNAWLTDSPPAPPQGTYYPHPPVEVKRLGTIVKPNPAFLVEPSQGYIKPKRHLVDYRTMDFSDLTDWKKERADFEREKALREGKDLPGIQIPMQPQHKRDTRIMSKSEFARLKREGLL